MTSVTPHDIVRAMRIVLLSAATALAFGGCRCGAPTSPGHFVPGDLLNPSVSTFCKAKFPIRCPNRAEIEALGYDQAKFDWDTGTSCYRLEERRWGSGAWVSLGFGGCTSEYWFDGRGDLVMARDGCGETVTQYGWAFDATPEPATAIDFCLATRPAIAARGIALWSSRDVKIDGVSSLEPDATAPVGHQRGRRLGFGTHRIELDGRANTIELSPGPETYATLELGDGDLRFHLFQERAPLSPHAQVKHVDAAVLWLERADGGLELLQPEPWMGVADGGTLAHRAP